MGMTSTCCDSETRSSALPAPQNGAAPRIGSKYTLVFPLSCGWSIVVDVRDASYHLKHLPTGTTAALPNLNTVCKSITSEIKNLGCEHAPESDHEEAPFPNEDSSCVDVSFFRTPFPDHECSTDQEAPSTHNDECSTDEEAPSPEDYNECGDSDDDGATFGDDWYRRDKLKIKIKYLWYYFFLDTYLKLSDRFNFTIHVPPGTPATSTEGMVIIMYHMLHGDTGMVFCRPEDAVWTKIANPNSLSYSFTDFAYFDGKMLALDDKGVMLVFDATTL
ncbi:hypothetical protein ACQ4PT_066632 [Festuca glaucescens]